MPPSSSAGSYLRPVTRRWWLFLLLPIVTVAVILAIASVSPPEYVATERLQINVVDPQEVPLFSQTRYTASADQIQSVHDEFYDVLRLPSVAWKTIADLGLDLSAQDLIARIDSQHQFDFVTVTAQMPAPDLAQRLVSKHVDNAIAAYRSIRSTPAQTSRDFIETELIEQTKTLSAAQEALQNFQLQNEVSDLERETLAYQDLKRTLRSQRDAAAVEAARNDRLAAEFTTLADQTATQLQTLQASTVVTPTKPANARTSIPAATPTPDPAILAEIDSLTLLVQRQRATANDYKAAAEGHRAAIAEYDRQISEQQQQLVYLLGLQERYKTLVDAVARAQDTYDFLSSKANEARLKLTQGENIGYLQVVEPARLPDRALPNRTPQILLVGVLVSLVLAVILAFILEFLENSLGKPTPASGEPTPKVARPS